MLTILLLAGMLAAPGETLRVEPATVDRGEIKAGAPLTQTFKISNPTSRTITLTGVRTSCDCARIAFDRSVLPPGESTQLAITVNTLAHPAGSWKWTAEVQYRGCEAATVPVMMTGTLIREVMIDPPALAFSVEAGEVSREIRIRDSRQTKLVITGLASTSKHLAVKQDGDAIRVVLAADAPFGESRETISIATSDADYPEFRIPVTISKRKAACVKAYPDTLDLDRQSDRIGLVQLRRPDGRTLRIEKCSVVSGCVVEWSKDAGLVATVRVRLAGEAAVHGEILIDLADPPGERLRVPVRWQ